MTDTAVKIRTLLDVELSELNDQRVLSHVRSLLVEPTMIMRDWDYGVSAQSFPCWAVLNHPKSNTGIAYCEFGFGPKTPWGLVALSDPSSMSIGQDSGWFESFTEAYFESFAAADLPIWRVFKQEGDTYPGKALTPESDWDSTWEEVYRHRAADTDGRYHCAHSIPFRRATT